MIQPSRKSDESPVIKRLAALASLDLQAMKALAVALRSSRSVQAHDDIQVEGEPVPPMQLLVSGWAARQRQLGDGRRQLLSFLLPGDLIGLCDQPRPVAIATITAITAVELCPAPSAEAVPALGPAYASSRALHEAYLLEQILRLGRLSARERIISLMLELHERLSLNGMADREGFDVPLTQEMLGDALGLTPVHINRMIQHARRAGDLQWQAGRVTLHDPAGLARWIGRLPVRVSSPS